MYLETTNEKAAELVRGAMEEICAYRRTKTRSLLSSAAAKLEEARTKDPEYLQLLYGRAQLDDLAGRAKDAIEEFERVLAESPPFSDEVEYHLGVAYYHRYNRPSLEKAMERFSSVAARACDPVLECRARLGIAQALCMRLIPSDPRRPSLDQIRQDAQRVHEQLGVVETLLGKLKQTDRAVLNELKSACHNSRALAWMYSSDFLWSSAEKTNLLERALSELRLADQHDPNNWAIQCDIASAWMRLGHWRESGSDFEQAREHLDRVIRSLRPGYGFALYELGRTFRLQGDFVQAVHYFDRALAIPYDYRDVSDRRLLLEKERASAQSKEYP